VSTSEGPRESCTTENGLRMANAGEKSAREDRDAKEDGGNVECREIS